MDNAASARRTWRRVVMSGDGEIEKQAAALGRGAARHCIVAAVLRAR
jgi:hypothetical protein